MATVCDAARCPNRPECFGRGTAAFMILGSVCTRNCGFCAVPHGHPLPPDPAVEGRVCSSAAHVLRLPPDPAEPQAVAEAAYKLGLTHVVITSVTRDDLDDGGAGHFARTIRAVRRRMPSATIEVLTPDFNGDPAAIDAVLQAAPDVFNHNLETVQALYPSVRPQADFNRGLEVLARAKRWALPHGGSPLVKSGLMLGLGESRGQVLDTMRALRRAGCDVLTIGQYLSPSPDHFPVERFVPPAEFQAWWRAAEALGFTAVAAGPFVRSSYRAGELLALHTPGRAPRRYPAATASAKAGGRPVQDDKGLGQPDLDPRE